MPFARCSQDGMSFVAATEKKGHMESMLTAELDTGKGFTLTDDEMSQLGSIGMSVAAATS